MKHLTLIALIVMMVTTLTVRAQESSSPFGYQLHGFVNPHYYADSRSVVGSREDMMLFYPQPLVLDSLGRDINDGWQANMLAITARLGLRVVGPDMLGAHTSAYIEGDFTGATNQTINNLRLRHAYLRLDWQHHSLVAGQDWHPMVVAEIMPMTNPLNMGAPFHPYSRQPQVRYTFSHGWLEAIGVALWQLDNMSQGLLDGAATSSTTFARHSLMPELNAQLRHRTRRSMVGIAFNLKTIQPVVPDPDGRTLQQSSTSIFGTYRGDHVTVKAQAIFHNTLYEIASMGGYTLLYNTVSGSWSALDETFTTAWIDLELNHGHWRPGIFAGAGSNTTPSYDIEYNPDVRLVRLGRGHNIGGLWRVQPRLTYTTEKGLNFTAEAEYTTVRYQGSNSKVANLRLSLGATYAF